MIILQLSDFKEGKFKIPQTNNLCSNQLQKYIDRYEKRYLIDLLGCELSELLIDDLVDGVPTDPLYLSLFNEICIDLRNGFFNYYYSQSLCYCEPKRIISRGLKSMLQGFIFFEYMRDFPNQRDLTGVNRVDSENTTYTEFSSWGLSQFYNESVEDYHNIQYYIHKNQYEYEDFNGTLKRKISIS